MGRGQNLVIRAESHVVNFFLGIPQESPAFQVGVKIASEITKPDLIVVGNGQVLAVGTERHRPGDVCQPDAAEVCLWFLDAGDIPHGDVETLAPSYKALPVSAELKVVDDVLVLEAGLQFPGG